MPLSVHLFYCFAPWVWWPVFLPSCTYGGPTAGLLSSPGPAQGSPESGEWSVVSGGRFQQCFSFSIPVFPNYSLRLLSTSLLVISSAARNLIGIAIRLLAIAHPLALLS